MNRCEICVERDMDDGWTRTCRAPAVAESTDTWTGQRAQVCGFHARETRSEGARVSYYGGEEVGDE